MPLKLNSSGGGSVTLDTPSTASTYTLTVPAITGTAVVTGSSATVSQGMLAAGVAGNGPAFFAYQNANQTISTSTVTAIVFQAELFDTNSNYDTSNGRFTPTVAGYYQISGSVRIDFSSGDFVFGSLKNGSEYGRFVQSNLTTGTLGFGGSTLVYLNGSTDYVQFMVFQSSGSNRNTLGSQIHAWFSGALVRAA
jgi:hypothetical protein